MELLVQPTRNGRWQVSDGSPEPLSEHETAEAAKAAARAREPQVRIVIRDRYGRIRTA